jgi:hypothetical protein
MAINTSNPRLRITATDLPGEDEIVFKVGQSTGSTAGLVEHTCTLQELPPDDKALICQYLADYGSADGDSGAPVFMSNFSGNPANATLMGIHHGRWSENANYRVFGWITTVLAELDSSADWNVCASGYTCS